MIEKKSPKVSETDEIVAPHVANVEPELAEDAADLHAGDLHPDAIDLDDDLIDPEEEARKRKKRANMIQYAGMGILAVLAGYVAYPKFKHYFVHDQPVASGGVSVPDAARKPHFHLDKEAASAPNAPAGAFHVGDKAPGDVASGDAAPAVAPPPTVAPPPAVAPPSDQAAASTSSGAGSLAVAPPPGVVQPATVAVASPPTLAIDARATGPSPATVSSSGATSQAVAPPAPAVTSPPTLSPPAAEQIPYGNEPGGMTPPQPVATAGGTTAAPAAPAVAAPSAIAPASPESASMTTPQIVAPAATPQALSSSGATLPPPLGAPAPATQAASPAAMAAVPPVTTNQVTDLQGTIASMKADKNASDAKMQQLQSSIDSLQKQIADMAAVKGASNEAPRHASVPKPVRVHPAAASAEKWQLRSATPDSALLAHPGDDNLQPVAVGDMVSGLGRITSISEHNGSWVVQGTNGRVVE